MRVIGDLFEKENFGKSTRNSCTIRFPASRQNARNPCAPRPHADDRHVPRMFPVKCAQCVVALGGKIVVDSGTSGRSRARKRGRHERTWQATPPRGELVERFQAKWTPVRVKKTRQIKNLEPRFDSIETEKALVLLVSGQGSRSRTSIQKTSNAKIHSQLARAGPIACIMYERAESAKARRLAPRTTGECQHDLHSCKVRVIGGLIQNTSNTKNTLTIRAMIRSRASGSDARNPRKPAATGAAHSGRVPAWLAFIKGSRNRRFNSENAQYENAHAIRA